MQVITVNIKLHIPESLQVLFGTLFAIAEAHFQLEGLDPDEPLIRIITTYEQIAQYMGEEIGVLLVTKLVRTVTTENH